jgi:exodeoxyribonuclease V beta subunit
MDNMETAIKANSYDLQYYIYSVALCRFLKQRIADFDYDKHFGGGFWVFLRGCRIGESTGIFHQKPEREIFESFDLLFG